MAAKKPNLNMDEQSSPADQPVEVNQSKKKNAVAARETVEKKVAAEPAGARKTKKAGTEMKKEVVIDAKAKETDVKYLEISLDDEQNNRYNDYDDNDNDDDDHDHEDDDHDDENHEKRYIYEVDFIYDRMEYSYEIDAESKEILQRQYESWWN